MRGAAGAMPQIVERGDNYFIYRPPVEETSLLLAVFALYFYTG
jgi:hypothetical protein